MKGRLFALEGIDGCGKSTQLKHLSQWLPQSGLMPKDAKLHITKEPGGTPLGKALRKFLLDTKDEVSPEPLTELLLYAADRAQHVSTFIAPLIQKGDWVITDRFSGSTLAYQGYGRQLDRDLILNLEHIATFGIVPDMTFWLHLPVKESVSRRMWTIDDRIEGEGLEFLQRVSEGFSNIAHARNWTKICADQSSTDVSRSIENALKNFGFAGDS